MKRCHSAFDVRTGDNALKKWAFLIFLAAFLVFVTMGTSRDCLATENLQPDWGGVYDITINTAEGGQVPAEIDIRDLGSGQVEVSGTFGEYAVNQLGAYSGDPKGEGLQAHFDINHFGLVRGFIDFTIRHTEGRYIIEGQGTAHSFAVGKMAGTFNGQRREAETTPPTPAPAPQVTPTPAPAAEPPNYLLWAAGAAAVLVLLWALAPRRRQNGPRR